MPSEDVPDFCTFDEVWVQDDLPGNQLAPGLTVSTLERTADGVLIHGEFRGEAVSLRYRFNRFLEDQR